jgi:hypothetical protein
VGKLVAAFVFFLAASALAIHESKPPRPRADDDAVVTPPEPRLQEPPPSRAVHEETPPWVKYASPAPAPPPVTKPVLRVITIEPSTITFENGDIPDVVDKCPDQPTGRDDEDGCPEPYNGPTNGLDDRIILID